MGWILFIIAVVVLLIVLAVRHTSREVRREMFLEKLIADGKIDDLPKDSLEDPEKGLIRLTYVGLAGPAQLFV